MSTTLTVDLDTLTPETAQKIAGFMLALAGFEDTESSEIDPAKVFGPASTREETAPPANAGSISTAGPHLVIPAPSTQASAAPPVPAPPGTIKVDSKGLPWDGRIHASTQAVNKDGSWKMKRGIDDSTVAQVESELRRVMSIPSPQHTLIAQPPAMMASTATMAAIPNPPAPIQITPQMQADYVAFIGSTSNAIHAGKLTEQELLQCLSSSGVESLPLLGARLDLLPSIAGIVNGIIAGRSA